jgi:predicted transcriptional regulator
MSSGIKVSEDVKEKIRLAAALFDLQQGQLVERAIDEYCDRRAADLQAGIQRAHAALLGGRAATLAYLLGEDPAVIARVSGGTARE